MISRLAFLLIASSSPSLAYTHNLASSHDHFSFSPLFFLLLLLIPLFKFSPKSFSLIASLLLFSLPSLALAHHPLDGGTPDTIAGGLFSGIAHPLFALDHLAFLVLVAFTIALSRSFIILPSLFLLSSLIGTLFPLFGISVPFVENFIILSLFVASILILIKYRTFLPHLTILFGFFHGFAFSEGIIGANISPFFAYLIGLSLSQTSILIGGALLFSLLARTPNLSLHKTSSFSSILVLGIATSYVYNPLVDLLIAYL